MTTAPQPNRTRRLRPRHIALIVSAAVVGLLVYAGSWVWWAYTVEPTISVDYAAELEQLAREAQPPGENGWPHLAEALDRLDGLNEAFPAHARSQPHTGGFDFSLVWNVDRGTQTRIEAAGGNVNDAVAAAREAVQWLDAQGVFAALGAATRTPNLVRPMKTGPDAGLISGQLGNLRRLRNLARARTADMCLAIEHGDSNDAAAAARELLALGAAMTRHPMMIDHLVGSSIIGLVAPALRSSVLAHPLDAGDLRTLYDAVRSAPSTGDPALAIEGERRVVLDTVQRIYSDDGHGDGIFLLAEAGALSSIGFGNAPDGSPPIMNLMGLLAPRRGAVVADLNRRLDELIRIVSLPATQQRPALAALENETDALPDDHLIVRLFIPALAESFPSFQRTRMERIGTELMLAVERHITERGSAPATLHDLVPHYLDDVPRDPISDQPFGYRRLGDGGGRRYLLYTIGIDGTDNGGAFPADAPFAAMDPTADPGADYLFNRRLRTTD